MKKIITIVILITLSMNSSFIYANGVSESKGKYVIINNQSTDPYELQNIGDIKNNSSYKFNQNEKTAKPYGVDKVIQIDEDNLKLYKQNVKHIKLQENTRKFKTINFKNNKEEIIIADLKYNGN